VRPRGIDDAAVIERYLAGEEVSIIAASFDVDQKTIYNVLKRNDVAKRQGRLTEAQKLDITARYAKGESAVDIAAALGVSKGTVYTVIRKTDTGTKRTMGSLSTEQEDLIITRYAAGEPVLQISRDFTNVHLQTIHNMLRRRGAVDPARAKPRVGAARESQILDAVRGGSNVPAVMQSFDVSEGTVSRLLRKTRADGEIIDLPQGRPRVYALDETAFDKLTPECLYWLGFIFADGCVYEDRLIVCLASVDVGHLKKLRDFLKSDYPIRHTNSVSSFNKDSTFVWLSPRSRHIANLLRGRGIVAKRTRFPPPELAESRDFWRGAVDGDGWLGVSDHHAYVGLSGQAILLEQFQDFLRETQITDSLRYTPTESGVYRIQTTDRVAESIIRTLYSNAIVALDRKNVRAQAIIKRDFTKSVLYKDVPIYDYLSDTEMLEMLRSEDEDCDE